MEKGIEHKFFFFSKLYNVWSNEKYKFKIDLEMDL